MQKTNGYRIGITTARKSPFSTFFHKVVYELEDALVESTGGQLIEIPPRPPPGPFPRVRRKLGMQPRVKVDAIERGLDLLVVPSVAVGHVSLDHVANWRQRCKRVIYFLYDPWPTETVLARMRNSFLHEIDYLAICFLAAVPFFRDRHGGPQVVWIPQATNPHRFHDNPGERGIFCSAMGRQDEAFLAALKPWCRRENQMLMYQSDLGRFRRSWEDSQDLFAETLRHSRYVLNWPMPVGLEKWATIKAIDPPSNRWFETAAAGSVMVGARPADADFSYFFPPDAVVDVAALGGTPESVFGSLGVRPDEARREMARRLSLMVRREHTWHNRAWSMLKLVGMEDAFRMPDLGDTGLDLRSYEEAHVTSGPPAWQRSFPDG